MRLGRHSWAGWLILSFLLLSFSAHSFLPLLARSVIGGVVGRVIVSRAAATAANDAVYLTMVSNTSRSLAASAASRVSSITSTGLFKTTSNAVTWAGIGYSLGQIERDEILPDGVGVDESGNYYIKNSVVNNTVVSGDSLSVNYPYYSYYHEKYYEGFNRHLIAKRVFGDVSAIEGVTCGFPTKKCTLTSVTGIYDGLFSNVRIDYEGKIGDSLSSGSYTVQVKENGDFKGEVPESSSDEEKDPIKVGKYISDKLDELSFDVDMLAKTINSVWMNAASKPDYQGVPFSSSNPVTAAEIRAVAPEVAKLTQQEWVKPAQADSNAPVEITINNSGNEVKVDFGDNPDIKSPELEKPPTGEEILKPITELMPDIKNLSISSKDVQCPAWQFELWGNKYSIDSHCELLEKIRPLLKAVFLLIWGIISLRIILTA